MSTEFGYVCTSHDPELVSEQWFNWGGDVLLELLRAERAGEWPDTPYPGLPGEFEPRPVVHEGYSTIAPVEWLRQHPRCAVVVRDEYGRGWPRAEGPGDTMVPPGKGHQDASKEHS